MKTFMAMLMIGLCTAGAAAAQQSRGGGAGVQRLDAARMLLFDRDWPGAVAELRLIVADTKHARRDEASLWLAHGLFQMGKASDALQVITMLERDHPRSHWLLPAQSLRVQIAARTGRGDVLWSYAVPSRAPQPPPAPPTPGTMTPPRVTPAPRPPRTPSALPPGSDPAQRWIAMAPARVLTPVDIRIEALSGLLQREPDRAVPVLREIVVAQQETPQARRALFVLSLSPHEEARETVLHFAQSGPESLRLVAVGELARWPSETARTVLRAAYASGSARVKLAALRSLGAAGADRELIAIARAEANADLRGYAVAQLEQINTPPARAFLRSIK